MPKKTYSKHKPDLNRLPGVITSIVPQKNNAHRFSIFVDEQFFVGISETTLLEFDLTKGDQISPDLFEEINDFEDRETVKSYCFRLLSRRDHARKELYDKAIRKDYHPGVINDVLDELEEKEYINAAAFARAFARDKRRFNNWGPIKIKLALKKKGISGSDAERAVEAAFNEVNEKDLFSDLVFKQKQRFLREENLFKRKKKIFDYLSRKGYRQGDIMKYLDDLMDVVSR